jgi:hypothetical protein
MTMTRWLVSRKTRGRYRIRGRPVYIRVLYDRDEIQTLRHRYATQFTLALRDKFPDPRDPTRLKAEVMIDIWWPVTPQREELVVPDYT